MLFRAESAEWTDLKILWSWTDDQTVSDENYEKTRNYKEFSEEPSLGTVPQSEEQGKVPMNVKINKD